MKLVKINDNCHVMPDEIGEVNCSWESRVITVRLKSGVGHKVLPEYGEDLSAAHRRIINSINEALA